MKVFALGTLLLATLSTFAPGVNAQNDTLEELNLLVVNGMFTGVVNQLTVLTESQRTAVFEAVPDAIRNVIDYICNALDDVDSLNTCTTLWDEDKKKLKGATTDGKKKKKTSKFGKKNKKTSKLNKGEKTSKTKLNKFQKKE